MKAMILAAGLGTRLRPLTNQRPKALVQVAGLPALEWAIRRLSQLGIQEIILNTHYLAEQIEAFVKAREQFPPRLSISYEPEILGTGGGLWQTRHFWEGQPFFLYNVDIFSTADLIKAYQTHQTQNPLATLLTQERPSQTQLLIDEGGNLCGIHYYKKQERRLIRQPQGSLHEQAFSGWHVISPSIFSLIEERGEFSIIDVYLRLSAAGYAIETFDIGQAYWKDMGTLAQLQQLEADWSSHPSLRKCYL